MTKKFVVVPQNSVVNIKVKVKGVTSRHLLSAPASENNERVRIIYSEGERPIPRKFDTEWGTDVYRTFSIRPHRPSRRMLTLFCFVPEKHRAHVVIFHPIRLSGLVLDPDRTSNPWTLWDLPKFVCVFFGP